jgi:hypothetical protein
VRQWLRNHAGRKITEDQVAELFGNAYQSAASVKNALSGFRKAGIEPYRRDAYYDDDYSAAAMTYKPYVDNAPLPTEQNDWSDVEPSTSIAGQAAASGGINSTGLNTSGDGNSASTTLPASTDPPTEGNLTTMQMIKLFETDISNVQCTMHLTLDLYCVFIGQM